MTPIRAIAFAAALATAGLGSALFPDHAQAASAGDIQRDSSRALQTLYRTNPTAALIGKHARAILIFPKIVKGGLIIGGAFGDGELLQGGKVDGYYNSVTGSWGLQAGAQSYGYVVFLMTPKAVEYIHRSQGWEIGVGPTVVVVDEGVARNLSSTTLKDDAYAFVFNQKGLMAGVSLEGSKISRIHPRQ
ncbi:MAG: lipid-binding SYLF domain-containing protein [Proteobacteria bacterium]|nr:lipid-binding SYLF domain-containing protein [Pseudomonadota bacterium]